MNKVGSNPFGVTTRLELSKTSAKVAKEGDGKQVDLVAIYLASVPALQKAKEELEKLRSSLKLEANGQKCEEWVKQIVKIMEEILDHTKIAIRGEIEDAAPSKPQSIPGVPTAGMIAGREPIPGQTQPK